MLSKPETERAWAAGFFDGEGTTIFVEVNAGARLMMSVGQVDRRNLTRFQTTVDGLGRIGSPRHYPHRQPYSSWVAYNKAALRALALLDDFLGPAKRAQAFEAVHRYIYRPVRPPGHCKRGHVHPPLYRPPSARGPQCALCRTLQRSGAAMPPIIRRPAIEFEIALHEYTPAPLPLASDLSVQP